MFSSRLKEKGDKTFISVFRVTNGNPQTKRYSSPTYRRWGMNTEQMLKKHIIEMFDGVINENFLQKRYRIATVHSHIGLEPKWYMSTFQDLLNYFSNLVQTTLYPSEEQFKMLIAVSKILNFEQQIVLESYEIHHQEESRRIKTRK